MKDEKENGRKLAFILPPSSFILGFRVIDGTRTRDIQDHNLALYQLSYDHQREAIYSYAAHKHCQGDGPRALIV